MTSKIHLVGEGGRRPLAFLITPGQWGDAPQLIPVLERLNVPRLTTGRPRTRPDHLSGDKTSHANKCQAAAVRRSSGCWIGKAFVSS